MIPLAFHIVAGLVLVIQVLALVAARGTLDHLLFYRILGGGGGSTHPHWLARPTKIGPAELRPYHALLFMLDAASVYALHLYAPVLAGPYLVALLFGCPDALVYHLWKRRKWAQIMPNGDRTRTRLPVRPGYHKKLYVWPVHIILFRVVVGRWTTEGEYRCGALVGLLVALALLI